MWAELKKTLSDLNKDGFPLPMVRDPKTGKGSITATSYWISLNLCVLCALLFVASIVAHLSSTFAPAAETQQAIQSAASYSMQLFLACGGFYLGRKMQGDGKKIDVAADEEKKD
jgi:hypothetical protein